MNEKPDYNAVRISAREIPPPSTISAEAQAILSAGASQPRMSWPSPTDKQGWRIQLDSGADAREAMAAAMLSGAKAAVETREIGGVLCYDCMPTEATPLKGAVYLFIHGGAFVLGGGTFAKGQGARSAAALGLRTVSVDYRMPPDHPFPAPVEDCVSVYEDLMRAVEPSRIVIGGSSAGGNLAAAATLMIRDRGLPLPAGTVLLTPEVDLTESGDSFRTHEDIDVVLKCGLPECNALYAGGRDLSDPYLSPLFADFSRGFPPTLIQSGTRDLFLSNSVRMHRRLRDAGIEAELHVWEAMPHGGFIPGEAPENEEIVAEVARFIRRVVR